MNFFVWVVKAEQELLLQSSKGVSNSYILSLPRTIPAKELAGAIVLIILRGIKGDILLKKIYVKKIDELVDDDSGLSNGKFLLSVNLLRSARISQDYSNGLADFSTDQTLLLPLGISKITQQQAAHIFEVATSHIQLRFTIPSNRDLSFSPDSIPSGLCTSQFALQLLKTIIKNYSLGSIWRAQKESNPFVNFALHHLPFFNRNDNAAVIQQLRAFSTGILSIDFSAEGSNVASPVDIDFEPIDPERIHARKFSAIERLCDIEASISKTEDAEQRHQMILQDICRYFLRIGITPQQSSSIDLAFQKDNQFVIFEIKTTTPENLGQQAGKGSFQLALYSHGMAISGLAVARRILILETSTNESFQDFIKKSVSSMNIEVAFYDPNKEWPQKLSLDFT